MVHSRVKDEMDRGPLPRRGQNPDFDVYCDSIFNDLDPEDADFGEMRRALWATWRTAPPTGGGAAHREQRDDEDDELQAALALSVEEASGYSRNASPHPDGDDDDLQRALAMSEAEARETKRRRRDDTPEEERKMLEEAMQASLAQSQSQSQSSSSAPRSTIGQVQRYESSSAPAQATPPAAAPSALKLGGQLIDRAQLERERLARQAARSASDTSAAPSTSAATLTSAEPSRSPSLASGRDLLRELRQERNVFGSQGSSNAIASSSSSKRDGPSTSRNHPFQQAPPLHRDAAGEYFLNGEIRHVALTIGEQDESPTFTLPQVVGEKSQISLLVLCSFVHSDEWLAGVLPKPEQVPTIMIRPHPRDMHPAWNGKVQAQPTGEVNCYPQMIGDYGGSAHMKFALIFYKTGRLRVMITTANMVDYDWEWIENTVFVQDFLPRSASSKVAPNSKGDDFVSQFRYLLGHMKVHKAVRYLQANHSAGPAIPSEATGDFELLSNYDWSRVAVRLVMSVPGYYGGWDEADKFGLCRLGKVLKEEGWVPGRGERVSTEYQGSSLGQHGLEWMDLFYNLCSGKDVRSLANRPKANSWPPMKIMFPSLATVKKSELGTARGGGTMFCGKAFGPNTRSLFHHAESKRGGVLMHAKLLVGIFEAIPRTLGFEPTAENGKAGTNGKRKADAMEDSGSKVGGWMYIGSHNFSSAAWGTFNFSKKLLSIRNYELGILLPLPKNSANATANVIAPYKRPPRPYGKDDVPWDQNAHRT